MVWWLAVLNTLAGVVTAGFGLMGLLSPARTAPTGVRVGDPFYARMYGARALPLGLAVAVVVWIPGGGIATILLLAVAAIAQAFDVYFGSRHRAWGMVAGAAFGTLCPLVGALTLL